MSSFWYGLVFALYFDSAIELIVGQVFLFIINESFRVYIYYC